VAAFGCVPESTVRICPCAEASERISFKFGSGRVVWILLDLRFSHSWLKNATICSLEGVHRRFRELCLLGAGCFLHFHTEKMEAVRSSETSVICRTTRRQFTERSILIFF
jgi:hypothetical protein